MEKKSSFRTGDWMCPKCNDHQFARNKFCRKCREPRPQNTTSTTNTSNRSQNSRKINEKRGDWYCSKCFDHQFARRTECRSCKSARPSNYNPNGFNRIEKQTQLDGSVSNSTKVSSFQTTQERPIRPIRPIRRARQPRHPRQIDFRDGDWNCSKCNGHQFASRTICRDCGAPKGDVSEIKVVKKE